MITEKQKQIKKLYQPKKRVFDLKILLAGDSGSGKTHLCGTYTGGPVHFYMFDKGGEKTLDKLLKDRKKQNITLDNFSKNDQTFSSFWEVFQQDNYNNFFDQLAEENGLLVLDSLTNANIKAIDEIAKNSGITPSGIGKKLNNKKGMAPAHWGQLLNWMSILNSSIQELPCAVAVTVHLHTLMNSDQEVVARYPSVNGQFRQKVAVDFDEAYLLETKNNKHTIRFTERYKYQAKSRVFSMTKTDDANLNAIAKAYINNQTTFK